MSEHDQSWSPDATLYSIKLLSTGIGLDPESRYTDKWEVRFLITKTGEATLWMTLECAESFAQGWVHSQYTEDCPEVYPKVRAARGLFVVPGEESEDE